MADRKPSRILKRRARSGGPATRPGANGVPAYFVGAYIPEDLHEKLISEAADNERSVSAQIIFLLKTRYVKPQVSQS